MLFSLPFVDQIPGIIANQISSAVADEDLVDIFIDCAKTAGMPATLHINVDTGMGRVGVKPENLVSLASKIAENEHVVLEGTMTHFPLADEDDTTFSQSQITTFDSCIAALSSAGITPGIVHASNSAATLRFPSARYGMVRVGISSYGLPPCSGFQMPIPLKPAMEFTCRVSFVKNVPAGTGLSYGHTFHAPCDTVIATVNAGYHDGICRQLSNCGTVLIRGRRFPLVGRVTMDQILVDLGPEGASLANHGDEVTLFGADPAGPTATSVADILNTINYEVVCNAGKGVTKQYVRRIGSPKK
jgi:alanine racemase